MITPEPHQIEQQLTALGHSVGVVLQVITGSSRTDDTIDIVRVNVEHIVEVCKYPWFANRNMEPYMTVARQGQAWLSV